MEFQFRRGTLRKYSQSATDLRHSSHYGQDGYYRQTTDDVHYHQQKLPCKACSSLQEKKQHTFKRRSWVLPEGPTVMEKQRCLKKHRSLPAVVSGSSQQPDPLFFMEAYELLKNLFSVSIIQFEEAIRSTPNEELINMYDRLNKSVKSKEKKLQDLYQLYVHQQHMKQGASNLVNTLLLEVETGSRTATARIEECKQIKQKNIERLLAIESELEEMAGTLNFQVMSLMGFAKVCPGDVYDVQFKIANQKWRSKCKIEAMGQKWSEAEFSFQASLRDDLHIKITEIGRMKGTAIGAVACSAKDFLATVPQAYVIPINNIGSMKIKLGVMWSPLDGQDKKLLKDKKKNDQIEYEEVPSSRIIDSKTQSLPSYGSSKSTPSRTSDVAPPPVPKQNISSPNQERRSSPARAILATSPQQERRRVNSNPSPVQGGRPRVNSGSNLLSHSPTSPNLPRHRAQTNTSSNGPGPPVSGGVPVYKQLASKINNNNIENRTSRHSPSNSTEFTNGKLPSPRGENSNVPPPVPKHENRQIQQPISPRHVISSRDPVSPDPVPNPSPFYIGLTVTIPEEKPKPVVRQEERIMTVTAPEPSNPVVTKVFDGLRKKSLPTISSNGAATDTPFKKPPPPVSKKPLRKKLSQLKPVDESIMQDDTTGPSRMLDLCNRMLTKLNITKGIGIEQQRLEALLQDLQESLMDYNMKRQRRPSITPSIESALAGFSFLKDDMSVISDSCSESSITVALTTKLILAKQWRRCQRALFHHLYMCYDLLVQYTPANSPLVSEEQEVHSCLTRQIKHVNMLYDMTTSPDDVELPIVLKKITQLNSQLLSNTWESCVSSQMPLYCEASVLEETYKRLYKSIDENNTLQLADEVCKLALTRLKDPTRYASDLGVVTVFQFIEFYESKLRLEDVSDHLRILRQELAILGSLRSKDDLVVMSTLQQHWQVPIVSSVMHSISFLLTNPKCKVHAANFLSGLKGARRSQALDIYIKSLEDEREMVCANACLAVAAMRIQAAISKLRHLAQTGRDTVKEAAKSALKDIGHPGLKT